jgi:DNA polymerase-3 subunit delta'
MDNPALYPWMQAQWQQWLSLQGRLGHAYLLAAPPGIGIEAFVLQQAQTLFCQHGNACGQCSGCHLFTTEQHPDFYHLRLLDEKKEIGVDQVRELIYQLNETSHQGGYKIAWVEQPELLNASAFNALLKTLEEPGQQTLFILTTHQLGRLPATIVSRCQKLRFAMPDLSTAQAWLQQQQPQADAALLKRALRLNWGAPLAALQWIEARGFEEDAEWKNALKQLQSGQKTVPQVVEQWLKWPRPEAVFDYFYQWTVAALRNTFYSENQGDAAAFDESRLQNWLRFQQAVLQAKESWLGNANKQLVLETLCLEWLESQQTQTPLQSGFAGKWIRGQLA